MNKKDVRKTNMVTINLTSDKVNGIRRSNIKAGKNTIRCVFVSRNLSVLLIFVFHLFVLYDILLQKLINTNMKNFLNNPSINKNIQFIMEDISKRISSGETIYPDYNNILRAFNNKVDSINVVILGQDPYHGKGQANGLAFSVNQGVKLPPSLKNIYKEIQNEYPIDMNFNNGDLTKWEKQGVVLLNSSLSVKEKEPNSHSNIGWLNITDEAIKYISNETINTVFMLWGAFAISKSSLISNSKHLILTSPHPSPFSCHRGFFGNNHFKTCNDYLKEKKNIEIDWLIS